MQKALPVDKGQHGEGSDLEKPYLLSQASKGWRNWDLQISVLGGKGPSCPRGPLQVFRELAAVQPPTSGSKIQKSTTQKHHLNMTHPIRNLFSHAAGMRACAKSLQILTPRRTLTSYTLPKRAFTPQCTLLRSRAPRMFCRRSEIRTYATKSTADEIIEDIQEQYATARDEFEIASEEYVCSSTLLVAEDLSLGVCL